jgi:hypothetical protein
MTPKIAMLERVEPKFIKFEGPGDSVEGKLLSIEKIKTEGGTAPRFTVEKHDYEMVSFLGTHQLSVKLRSDDIGHFIYVVYAGESEVGAKNGNKMREFKVAVSKRPVKRVNDEFEEVTVSTSGVESTDSDIPF